MEKKNLLFVLPFIPYPLESGGHQALFNGIRAVCGQYNVLITYEAEDDEGYRSAESGLRQRIPGIVLLPSFLPEKESPSFIQNVYATIKRVAKRVFGVREYVETPELFYGWLNGLTPKGERFAKHLKDVFSNNKIDIVQVEMPWMIGAIYNIPEGVKKVFVHHEIGFVRHELEMDDASIHSALTAQAYSKFTKMIEVNLLNEYDTIITLSEIDKQKLLSAGVSVPIITSLAVVDADGECDVVSPGKTLSFIGSDGHNPNYVGLLWFLEHCWPLLKERDNEYQIKIIGKWASHSKAAITSRFPDVSFLGYVDDLNDAISGTVMIVPITIGSGIRMKILDAAARGIPFVSTSVGVEGLPMVDGTDCFIRDDPEGFVEAIMMYQDEELSVTMANNAREKVRDGYSFAALEQSRLLALDFADPGYNN